MRLLAQTMVALVAVLHLWFMVLEMFLWTTPQGRKTFRTTQQFAEESRALAANQGLYNGFLAAGLLWGLSQGAAGNQIKLFFLGCVIVAGAYGAYTVSRRIFWIQALPAIIALILIVSLTP